MMLGLINDCAARVGTRFGTQCLAIFCRSEVHMEVISKLEILIYRRLKLCVEAHVFKPYNGCYGLSETS